MASVKPILESAVTRHPWGNFAIALACLFLIGITWWVTLDRVRFERTETIANAVKQNENLAIAYEEQTIRTLKGVDQAVLFVKNQYDEHRLKLNIRRMIENGTLDASLFSFIGITDERGNVVLGSYEFKPTNLADRESFKVHQQNNNNEMFIGKPNLGRITRKWAIPMSHRINKTDGSFGGMVYASVDPEYFTGFYQKADLGGHGAISLVGLDGFSRATRIGRKGTFGEDMRGTRIFEEQAKNSIGSFLGGGRLDGVVRFLSFRKLAQYPLIVTVGTSESEAMAPFHAREHGYYLNALVASAIILAFAAFMTVVWSRQKRAVDSLIESEARYRATFGQGAVGVAHTTLDGRFIEANAKVSEILGYTGAELSTMNAGDVIAPADLDQARSDRARLVTGDLADFVAETGYVRKDGSAGWISRGMSVVRDASGSPKYCISLFFDITERKHAERTAREQYRLAEAFFNHSVSCLVVLDRDFNFLRVNAAYARACGRDISEFAGRNHFDLYPSDAKAIFQEVVRTRRPFETCARAFRFPDQPERGVTYWDWTLVPILDAQGEVEYLVFSLNEVTERKRSEQLNAQLAAIVESSNDVIMIRGPDRAILSWNAAAERLFGWSAQEAVGQCIDLIVPPERIGILQPFIERAASGEPVSPIETTHLRKDGARIPTQITLSPVRDGDGNVIAHSYTVRDMTKLKRNEEALHSYATRLRELSRRLREVEETERQAISRELHDRIGQELSTLTLLFGKLAARLTKESPSAVQKQLEDMQGLLKSTVGNVRDVMAELRPPVLDDYGLHAALRQWATEFAERSGISVELIGVDLQPRLPSIVETAMFRISQEALNNIAKHAQAKKVEISLSEASERVVLDIADDGVGFDAGETRQDGQHWGMITMRERAEAVGIALRLESAPGAGTRVVLEVERAAS